MAGAAADTLRGGGPQASFVGAMAIADLVKTTLGPKGMVTAPGPGLPSHLRVPHEHQAPLWHPNRNRCCEYRYSVHLKSVILNHLPTLVYC